LPVAWPKRSNISFSSSLFTGFFKWPTAPIVKLRSPSSSAETMRTGISRVTGFCLSTDITALPSRSGKPISSKMPVGR
jgi:hypothetical protein